MVVDTVFSSLGFPPSSFFVILAVIVALAFVFLASRFGRKANIPSSGYSRKRWFVWSFSVATVFGILTYLVSRSELSWLLAVAIFYHQFFVQRKHSS
jgi:hypothetical protein